MNGSLVRSVCTLLLLFQMYVMRDPRHKDIMGTATGSRFRRLAADHQWVEFGSNQTSQDDATFLL